MISAEEIKEMRDKMGVNQQQLAEILDVSQTTVARWESGQVKPTSDNAKNLVKLREVVKKSEEEDELDELRSTVSTGVSFLGTGLLGSVLGYGAAGLPGGIIGALMEKFLKRE